MQSPLIYVAGPYSKPDPVENTHRIIHIVDALWDLGVVPFVPHLTLFWHFLRPRTYEESLHYDLHLMARCGDRSKPDWSVVDEAAERQHRHRDQRAACR